MLNRLFNHDTPEREDGLVPVARLSDLALGQLKKVTVKGQSVVLTLVAQDDKPGATDVVAFASMCPHSLGDLSQGWMDNDEVDCPVHYYRFNVRTGACNYPKGGPKLRIYPVTVEGNHVLIKVEPPKWMDTSEG
jgi:nitrite reductase/ring-hydroxylating ferredoxin subunit